MSQEIREGTINPVTAPERNQESLPQSQTPVTAIEEAANNISSALDGITKQLAQKGLKLPQSQSAQGASLRAALDKTLFALRSSPILGSIGNQPIDVFWRHRRVCGQVLSGRKVAEFADMSTNEIWSCKGLGKVRLVGLIDALNFAMAQQSYLPKEIADDPALHKVGGIDCEWTGRLPDESKTELWRILEPVTPTPEPSPVRNMLKRMSRVLGFENMVIMWMCSNTYHRRVAERIGVTESRVSQILNAKTEQFRQVFQSELPDMYSRWQQLLKQPAVHQSAFMSRWLERGLAVEERERIANFIIVTLGGQRPRIQGEEVQDCWCLDPDYLFKFAREVEAHFPMIDRELRTYLESRAPDTHLPALAEGFSRTTVHVGDPGVWYADREKAVEFVLRQAGKPLTRNQIAKALGVKPTQTKTLLLMHPGIERVGSNLKRVYTLRAR